MNEQELKAFFKKTFNAVADGYDNAAMRFFPESAAHIPSLLALKGNDHILDVATGTGIVALTLADKLPHGYVTGIDFSTGMLSQAEKKKEQAGITNVTFHEMDMQAIELGNGTFDAAVSAFGIFFVNDMHKQLRHISDRVKDNGKVLVTTFYKDSFLPLVDIFLARLKDYDVDPPTMAWKRVATEQQCTSLFQEAGLGNVTSELIDHGYYLKDASDWWHIVWNGGFRGLVNQLSDTNREQFKEEHLYEIAALSTDKGIRLEMQVLYTVGTRNS